MRDHPNLLGLLQISNGGLHFLKKVHFFDIGEIHSVSDRDLLVHRGYGPVGPGLLH